MTGGGVAAISLRRGCAAFYWPVRLGTYRAQIESGGGARGDAEGGWRLAHSHWIVLAPRRRQRFGYDRRKDIALPEGSGGKRRVFELHGGKVALRMDGRARVQPDPRGSRSGHGRQRDHVRDPARR